MKTTTLKDIAKEAGFSITTVSKALSQNEHLDVSKKTKEKVQHIARKLHYTPNQLAINLKNSRTYTIGVILPTVVHCFFARVLNRIIEKAEKNGYLVIALQSNEKSSAEKKMVNLLLDKKVDGILISLSNETKDFTHLKKILSKKIPLVLFDKIEPSIDCSKVSVNDKQAAYEAVSFLISKGHKKIAHFRGDLNPKVSKDRFEGYKKALIDHGILYDPSLIYVSNTNSDYEDGYSFTQKLLAEHPDVDAIFTVTDLIAIGAINFLQKHSIKIPEDIAVFGFSNWTTSSMICPALSTVEQPSAMMGEVAVKILLEEIRMQKEQKAYNIREIILPAKLIIRQSC